MVSDAELDRWEDQPHEINLAAVREVCRELIKRRELDAEVITALTSPCPFERPLCGQCESCGKTASVMAKITVLKSAGSIQ